MFKQNVKRGKIRHRILSVLLASAMIISSLPFTGINVSAEELSSEVAITDVSNTEISNQDESSEEETNVDELSQDESSKDEFSAEESIQEDNNSPIIVPTENDFSLSNENLGSVHTNDTYAYSGGDGSELNPYQIASLKDLNSLAGFVNGGGVTENVYFKQTANITITGDYTPIGVYIDWRNYKEFNGIYDGGNFEISGSIGESSDIYQAVFGKVKSATIKNLKTSVTVIGDGNVAGVVANAMNGSIINCHNSGNISGSDGNVAGIVASSSNLDIQNCSNSGKIFSTYAYVGGITGRATAVRIENCYNTGEIENTGGPFGFIGGIIGDSSSSSINGKTSLDNCYNTGKIKASQGDVGGLVGRAIGETSITKCYNKGEVYSDSSNVGGIIGSFGDSSSVMSSVTNCYNDGSVTSSSSHAGGIVGYNPKNVISNCYNTAAIIAKYYIGGITGNNRNNSKVTNSYNVGTVSSSYSGTGYIGGIAGTNQKECSISNCYNIAVVKHNVNTTTPSPTYAVVGTNYGTVTNCYYNTDIFGVSSSDTKATGLTSAEMSGLTDDGNYAMTGIDETNWKFTADVKNGLTTKYTYPVLKSNEQKPAPTTEHSLSIGDFFNGDGTEKSPYKIASLDDLNKLAILVNGGQNCADMYFEQTANIKITGDYTPIGIYSSYSNVTKYPFSGNYDGGNFVISGTINGEGKDYQSVFGHLNNAQIENLKTDIAVKGERDTAGIASYVLASVIKNCANTGDITATGYHAGGIVGYIGSDSEIINCYNTGNISSANGQYDFSNASVGGIAGAIADTKVTNCYNTGNISGTSKIAGIVGSSGQGNYNNISNCYNIGKITGISWVNGICGNGSSEKYIVTNSYYNSDDVTGQINNSDNSTDLTTAQMLGLDENVKMKLGDDWTESSRIVNETNWSYIYPVLISNNQNPPPSVTVAIPTLTKENFIADGSNQSYNYGEAAKTLSVTASVTDGGTLSYQWYLNDVAIEGETGASFTPPTNALGNKTYSIVVTNTLNGVSALSEAKQTVSVSKSTVAITVNMDDWTYGETSKTPNATTTSNGTITYKYYSDAECKTEISKPTNAGTYYVKATVEEADAYYSATSEADSFIISAKEVAVVWNIDTTYTYTDESLTVPTASIVGVNNDGTIALTVSEDNSKAFKNAGNYNFTASLSNTNYALTNNTKEVTVAKAVSVITITMAETSIYGETVAPVITSNFGQDELVIKYCKSSSDIWIDEFITDSGRNYIEVKLAETDNYLESSAIKQYIIKDKELSDANAIITGAVEKTYTGDKIEQVAEDIVVKFGDKTLTNGTEYVIVYGNNTNVGKARLTVYFVGNYTGKATTYFDITPKSISDYIVEDIASVTYTGSVIEPSVAVTGLTFGTDYTVEYKDNQNSGKATVTIKGTGNYKDTITKEFEINQATPTVVLEATKDPVPVMTAVVNAITFGLLGDHEDTYTITATVTGVNDEKPTGVVTIMDGTNTVASDLKVTGGVATYAWTGVTAKNYELTAEFTSSDNNYTDKISDTVGYTIEKAEQAISISDVGTKTFGDSDFNLVVNGVKENAKLSYAVTGSAVVVDESGKVTILSKGEVTIKVTVDETTNYNSGTAITTFKVGQKEIQESDFTFAFDNLVYTGSEITPVTSTLTSDDYTITYFTNVNVGNAFVTIEGKGNYSGTISKPFVISPKQLTVTGTSVANKIYDGETSAVLTGVTISGNVTGETPDVTATATFSDKNVGIDKDVEVVYSITDDNYIAPVTETVKANITAKQLTISGTEVSDKAYDGKYTAIVRAVGTVADNVTGETVIITATATFNDKNVGTEKDVTVVYAVTDTNYIAPVNAIVKANVTAIDLTVIPNTLDKFYGENDDVLTYTFSGNLTGETPNFTGTLERVSGEEIGTYLVSQNDLDIVDNGKFIANNYNLVVIDTVVYTIKEYATDDKVAEKTDWFNDKTVTLTAPTGYTISLTNGVSDTFTSELTVDTTEGKAQKVKYFLRNSDGAISTEKIFSYNNEKIAPTGEITIDTSTWDKFLETITFGIYKSDDVEVSITSIDELSGVKSTEYYVSETAKTLNELEKITTWTEYSAYSITAEDAKTIVVYAKITDNAGNVVFLSSDGVLFDTTRPVITGVENFKFYKTDLNIKVTDANLDIVTLDGEEVESEFVIKAGTEQNYELIATDKAGNSKKIYFRTYIEKAPVDEVLDSLLPSQGDEFSKMVINNLTEEVITNTDKETAKDKQEELDILNKLDKAFQEVNGNITVISTKPIIEEEIEDDKKVVISEVVPQGLAVAVYGTQKIQDNIELSLSIKQQFSEEEDDLDKLVFEVKPLVSVNGAEPTIISNDDIKSPVTFRLYLNDGFKGTVCTVEHIKENGDIEIYKNQKVNEDEIGKYTELSVSEFSNFKVSEIKYKVSVDGAITEYKATEKVTLVIPTKDGYEFKGFVSEDVTITNNEFTMPEKDVTITSVWKEKSSTPDTGDKSNIVLSVCMMIMSLIAIVGVFINKKRILNK